MKLSRRKMNMLISLLVLLVLLVVLYWRTSRAAYESARYTVVRAEQGIEIRDYAALVLAETPMTKGAANRDGGFLRLFRFITGSNESKQKLAMTTPVLIDTDPSAARMAFVLPASVELSAVARPTDPSVSLRRQEPVRYAALRFYGTISEQRQDEAYARLLDRLKAMGMEPQSGPQFAYYDPPWTPTFLRRNEVLVEVSGETRR